MPGGPFRMAEHLRMPAGLIQVIQEILTILFLPLVFFLLFQACELFAFAVMFRRGLQPGQPGKLADTASDSAGTSSKSP